MYTILPFNFKRFSNEVLIVNECGNYMFLDFQQFDDFINYKIKNSDLKDDLESNLFLTESENLDLAITKTAARYRSRKEFLRTFTSLHMMVITLRCNQKCEYCQVSSADENSSKYDMSIDVAEKIVDFIFSSPTRYPKIEFQGGEPTLNWNVIVSVVNKAEKIALYQKKDVEFVICTNLLHITDEQLEFCKNHKIDISTSLDGPKIIHDKYRLARIGSGTYDKVIERIQRAREYVGNDHVSALMTTTSNSLDSFKEIIDEYLKLDLNGIFIRSLNPYGFAAEKSQALNYPIELFVEKYLEALKYIFKINKTKYFPEFFATLIFSRILTSFSTGFVDLQSPSGAGISGVIYDYDGSVFPADEARMLARMGDRHFCLGNVNTDTWENIFLGYKQKSITKNACVEVTVPCSWCVYKAYCGTDPVRNYLETGSEIRNMCFSPFCIKNQLIFDKLFEFLKSCNDTEKDIIWSWITRKSYMVKKHENN